MFAFVNKVRKLLRRDEGATMVEYGLMLALIALVCLATVGTIGNDLKNAFTKISTEIAKAVGS
jgi:pilus assembly protein Flp/PilA